MLSCSVGGVCELWRGRMQPCNTKAGMTLQTEKETEQPKLWTRPWFGRTRAVANEVKGW